jgi:filamentous hemagglutinin family protein
MNQGIFKLIFSRRWGMRVPVSEALPTPHCSGGHGTGVQGSGCTARYASLKPLAWALAFALAPPAWANPTGAQVVHGTASFATQGNTLTVTNSPNAIINWQSFSIPGGSTTHFAQQSASSAVLNRVVGPDPSQILGTLSSNGRVFLINPAGILVGAGARIDVNGLVASTLNLSNADFLAGRLNFTNGLLAGDVKNQGSITTPQGGQVYLVGKNVTNEGSINSPQGQVILAAGETVDILDSATPDVKVEITGTGTTATNLGQVVADSGRIGVIAATVRNQGTLNASSAVAEGGKIFLRASQRNELTETSNIQADGTKGGEVTIITNEHGQIVGELVARGTISAQGSNVKEDGRQAGGFIETSAAKLDIKNLSIINSGGTWYIDPQDIYITAFGATGFSNISPFDIATALDGGVDVTIDTNTTGTDLGDIYVRDNIYTTVQSGATSKLTLKANNNIYVEQEIDNDGQGILNVDMDAGNSIFIESNIGTNGQINLIATSTIQQESGSFSSSISNTNSIQPQNITLSAQDILLSNVRSNGEITVTATNRFTITQTGSESYVDDQFFSYSLPFGFTFFGTTYSTAYISTNGLITFDNGTTEYSDSLGGLAFYKGIAPAWNDWILRSGTGKDITIKPSATTLYVQWDVSKYSDEGRLARFESVLQSNGNINFNYGAANDTFANDVTIGISNGTEAFSSQLLNEPNFSLNFLRSTSFIPNSSGGYSEILSATSTPLTTGGTISGLNLLGQSNSSGSSEAVNTTGNMAVYGNTLINGGILSISGNLQSNGLFNVQGGSVTVGGTFSTEQLVQALGSVQATNIEISQGASQTGGTLTSLETLTIEQDSGDLQIANLQADTINISANAGSILSNGLLQADSITINASQSIGTEANPLFTKTTNLQFNTEQSIFVFNNDPRLGLQPSLLNISGGALQFATVTNYGETTIPTNTSLIGTTGVKITANSPLNINGTLSSEGEVLLTAANPGDLTINGNVSGGSVFLNAPGGAVAGNIPPNAVINQTNTPVTPPPPEATVPLPVVNTEQSIVSATEETSKNQDAELQTTVTQVRTDMVLSFLDDDPEVVLYTLMQLDASVQEEEEKDESQSPVTPSSERSGDEPRKPDFCPC